LDKEQGKNDRHPCGFRSFLTQLFAKILLFKAFYP